MAHGLGMLPCRCLPEPQARRLFQQLMVAVDFLHHLGIANRDIKVLTLLKSICQPFSGQCL